jgi:transketolase
VSASGGLEYEVLGDLSVKLEDLQKFRQLYCSKDPAHRDFVLPAAVTARVSVEQASTFGWER